MGNAAGGLSDALRQLSEGVQELPVEDDEQDGAMDLETAKKPQRKSTSKAKSSASQAQAASAATTRPSSRSASASSAGGASRQPSAKRIAESSNLKIKQIAVPVLIATGILLMLPGIWGILVLLDWEVIGFDRPGARLIAVAMLLAWPLALFMFGGAGFFYWQTQQIKRDMKTASKTPKRR